MSEKNEGILSPERKDTYFVALKVFLEQEGKLFIFKDRFGDWDLPGGRIKPDEFSTPPEDVISRKMNEELGEDVRYTLGSPTILMRHERVEVAPGNPTVRIFAVGFPALVIKGEVKLSPQHTEFLWVDPENFNPEEYFTGGWLDGVKKYLEWRKQAKF